MNQRKCKITRETIDDNHEILINKMYLPTHLQASLQYEAKVIKLFQNQKVNIGSLLARSRRKNSHATWVLELKFWKPNVHPRLLAEIVLRTI